MKSKTNISIVDNAKIRRKSDIIIGKKGEFPSGDILDANATKELVDNVAESVQAITDMAPEDFDTLKEAADAVNDLQEQIEAAKNCINVTYSEIVALRDANKLISGQWYRITDYVATTTQTDTRSANHPFDILVQAIDGSHLKEDAYAALHEGDAYFANSKLEAWKLNYCLDNDTERFGWADTENGKGVIYRMIDEFNNDVCYDFKGIQFLRVFISGISSSSPISNPMSVKGKYACNKSGEINRLGLTIDDSKSKWFYTFSTTSGDNSIIGNAYHNIITTSAYDGNYGKQLLSDIVLGTYNGVLVYNNVIREATYITIIGYCYKNVIYNGNLFMTSSCANNFIGNGSGGEIIIGPFEGNYLQHSGGIASIDTFSRNKITGAGGMLFKQGASNNIFINSADGATFPSYCNDNIFINSSGNSFTGGTVTNSYFNGVNGCTFGGVSYSTITGGGGIRFVGLPYDSSFAYSIIGCNFINIGSLSGKQIMATLSQGLRGVTINPSNLTSSISDSTITIKQNVTQVISVDNQSLVQLGPTHIIDSASVRNIVLITQAEYDALTTKDPNTEYNIIESV